MKNHHVARQHAGQPIGQSVMGRPTNVLTKRFLARAGAPPKILTELQRCLHCHGWTFTTVDGCLFCPHCVRVSLA